MPESARLSSPDQWVEILTGDDWAPWVKRTLAGAKSSVLLSVYMISPNWRTSGWTSLNLVDELAACAQRGVKCRALIDQPNVNYRTKPFNIAAATQLRDAGWRVRVMPDARTLHEKILVIDHAISIVGSHNISLASATSNYDTSLAVGSADLAERLRRQFWGRWRLGRELPT